RRETGADVVEPPHALGVGDREELAVQVGVVVDLEVPLPADEERLALGEVEPLPTELHLHRHCCRPYPQACSNCDRTPRSLTAATSIQVTVPDGRSMLTVVAPTRSDSTVPTTCHT